MRQWWRTYREVFAAERAATAARVQRKSEQVDALDRWKTLFWLTYGVLILVRILRDAVSWWWLSWVGNAVSVPFLLSVVVIVATWLTRWGNGGRT